MGFLKMPYYVCCVSDETAKMPSPFPQNPNGQSAIAWKVLLKPLKPGAATTAGRRFRRQAPKTVSAP